MGPQDLINGILVLAAIKTGHKLLLHSPRNTLEAHLHLLQETDCHPFLVPQNFPLPVITEIQNARKLRVVDIEPLSHWLEDTPHKIYPYTKAFAEARQELFVVVYTSGSTGMPKQSVQTHETWTSVDLQSTLPALGHPDPYPYLCRGKQSLQHLPPLPRRWTVYPSTSFTVLRIHCCARPLPALRRGGQCSSRPWRRATSLRPSHGIDRTRQKPRICGKSV